jgi:hypothetical protein
MTSLSQRRYARARCRARIYPEGKEVETSWCVKQVEEDGAALTGKVNMHELWSGESPNSMLPDSMFAMDQN